MENISAGSRKVFLFLILLMVILSLNPVYSNPLDLKQLPYVYFIWTQVDGNGSNIYISKFEQDHWTSPTPITQSSTNKYTPSITIDKKGNPWIVWVENDGISTSIYSTHRTKEGWAPITQVDDPDIYEDTTPYIFTDSKNRIWVVWSGSDGNYDQIYCTRWNGRQWDTPVMVNQQDESPDASPVIFEDQNGKLIVVWSGYNGRAYTLYYSIREDNVWAPEKQVREGITGIFPSLLIAGKTPQLYWEENGIQYKALWDGNKWSKPQETRLVIPDYIYKQFHSFTGTAFLGWREGPISQSLRVPPISSNIPLKTARNLKPILFKLSKILSLEKELYAEPLVNTYIAFGDSITYGYPYGPGEGYPKRLEDKLNSMLAPSVVYNEGVPGERTSAGRLRADSVLTKHNAEYLLLMEGTNDITYGLSTGHIIFNLREIANRALAIRTKVILAGLPCRINPVDSLDVRTKEDVNPAIKQLAEELKIPFLDTYSELAKNRKGYMYDHVHPNRDGYELMSWIWFNEIRKLKQEKSDNSGCGIAPPVYPEGNGSVQKLSSLMGYLILLIPFFLTKKLLWKRT